MLKVSAKVLLGLAVLLPLVILTVSFEGWPD